MKNPTTIAKRIREVESSTNEEVQKLDGESATVMLAMIDKFGHKVDSMAEYALATKALAPEKWIHQDTRTYLNHRRILMMPGTIKILSNVVRNGERPLTRSLTKWNQRKYGGR